ncbi:MAG TPA: hypothetical protein VJN92_07305 [Candidatus Acidoferrum sp.]|nr:hypothetical protein [Candidatus Acidoferrum sp.]
MLQETSTWDLRSLSPPVPPGFDLYLLFLLATCLSATAKLVKLWRAAPPFRLERQQKNTAYVQMLEVTSSSLRQWTVCTFLAWGILASASLYDFCDRLLSENAVRRFEILFAIEGFSTALTMALVIVLFLFLLRWHILRRIEWLRQAK